jgi:NAD(P)H-flavin reductase
MEYTGIAPFAVLVFLCLFSAPWFRQVCYELFVHSHIAAAIAFLGTMFWHCANTGDSWIYLWATVAIWGVQLGARAWDKTSMFEVKQKRRSGTAHFQVLDDEFGQAAMLRIAIQTSLSWSPGQHAFLRFPKLALLDNHPFTMASVSTDQGEKDDLGVCKTNELLFLVRPYSGLTMRLLEHTKSQASPEASGENMPRSLWPLKIKAEANHHVLIDGPYGGLEQHRAMHRLYDHVVLVAGGGGISAMLPWLVSLSRQIAGLDEPCRVQRVDLIWCIRHANARAWIEDELQDCLRLAGHCVHVDVYVTDGEPGDASSSRFVSEHVGSDDERPKEMGIIVAAHEKEKRSMDGSSSDHDRRPRIHAARPYLPSLLPSIVKHRRTIIMGCGPESLKIDLSNTAAKLQSTVLGNEAGEIVLHTETFGW